MAKPIKETPVLYGKDADRFLRQVARNAKRDHAPAFARAKAVYERFAEKAQASSHVQTVAR